MNIEETTQLFIEEYAKLGFVLSPKLEIIKDLFFKINETELQITEDEIQFYCDVTETLKEFVLQPNECSICSLNYREQAIDEWNSRMIMPFGDKKFCEFKTDENVVVEIGSASDIFMEFFRFSKDFFNSSIPTDYCCR